MTAIAILSRHGETCRVEDGGAEYMDLINDYDDPWDIVGIIEEDAEPIAEPVYVKPVWEGRFADIRAAFLDAGWMLDHVSADGDGTIRSVYFARFAGPFNSRRQERIRVSDHHLGVTVYGEEQGKNLAVNIVLDDFRDDQPVGDFVLMADDGDAYELALEGYATTDEDWAEKLEEKRNA